MLDARVYRLAFVPAVLAVVLAAFALVSSPTPSTTTLEPDTFDAARAYGTESVPPRDSLLELARRYPDRRPGSAGDNGVAARVEAVFRANGFQVRRQQLTAEGPDGRVDLQNVIGVRAGVSSRRLAVMASRDATARGSTAQLSGTAALMELARMAGGGELEKTLVLVSTSGGTLGGAGARVYGERSPGQIDGVLALGDLASERARKPWVVPWSNTGVRAPLQLTRTVETAVRREVGADPGSYRMAAQGVRLAFPIAFGDQAELGRVGLPAAQLSVSGEIGPAPDAPTSPEIFEKFGRAATRSVSALDGRRGATASPGTAIVLAKGKLLEGWVIRLLAAALLLPVLAAAIDAFARANRRQAHVGAWLVWTALGALPFAFGFLLMRLLDASGVLRAPNAPVQPETIPFDAGNALAIVCVLGLGALGWFGLRRIIWREVAPGERDPGAGGGGAATALALALAGLATWAVNPYAALVLLPAIHCSMLVGLGDGRPRWSLVAPALVLGVLPPLLAMAYIVDALGLGLGGGLWSLWLLFAGGHVSLPAVGIAATLLGCLASVLAILHARERTGKSSIEQPLQTRGPMSYAGPGSLGGTESALRR